MGGKVGWLKDDAVQGSVCLRLISPACFFLRSTSFSTAPGVDSTNNGDYRQYASVHAARGACAPASPSGR